MPDAKQMLKRIVPASVLAWRRARQLNALRRRNSLRSLEAVFTAIYRDREWGTTPGDQYNSGSGSQTNVAIQYCTAVKTFVKQQGIRSLVDLGCGDFRVGSMLLVPGVSYVGIDVVADLISHNHARYSQQGVTFLHRDITKDELPDGELCLLRQVLQHLSNAEICRVLDNVRKYPRLIITEHLPSDTVDVVPNLDKPHGSDTRVYDNSGVFLGVRPFDVFFDMAIFMETRVDRPLVADGEVLRSFLVENRRATAMADSSGLDCR